MEQQDVSLITYIDEGLTPPYLKSTDEMRYQELKVSEEDKKQTAYLVQIVSKEKGSGDLNVFKVETPWDIICWLCRPNRHFEPNGKASLRTKVLFEVDGDGASLTDNLSDIFRELLGEDSLSVIVEEVWSYNHKSFNDSDEQGSNGCEETYIVKTRVLMSKKMETWMVNCSDCFKSQQCYVLSETFKNYQLKTESLTRSS